MIRETNSQLRVRYELPLSDPKSVLSLNAKDLHNFIRAKVVDDLHCYSAHCRRIEWTRRVTVKSGPTPQD